MPNGVITRLTSQFTGAGASTLPVVMDPPYALPLSDMDARFVASHNVTGTTAVSSWGSTVGTMSLAVAGTATAPAKATVDGRPVLSFNGVSNELRRDFTTNQAQPFTVALVLRNNHEATITGTRVFVGGTKLGASRINEAGSLQQTSTTGFVAYGGTLLAIGGAAYGSITVPGWHVLIASFNGASTRSRVDGYARTGNAGVLSRSALSVGGEANSFYSACDVAEVVTWPRALDAAEQGTVVTAMQAHYGL